MGDDARTGSWGCRRRGSMDSTQRWTAIVMCVFLSLSSTCSGANSYVWSNSNTRNPTSDITCWTCSDKANNDDCNNWAPDLRCPINHTVCQTVHRFSSPGGSSVQVTKRCVQASECTPQHVGCSQPDPSGQQECVSCCDFSYCNQEVPVNRTTALQLSSFRAASTSPARTLRPDRLAVPACALTAALWYASYRPLWTSPSWTS